ncbi:unnamed protein product, partial [Polarella glacialis]
MEFTPAPLPRASPCWFQLPLHSPRLRQHWVHDEEQGPITWHCRQPVSGRSRQHRQRTDQHPSLLVAAPSWPHGSICSAAVVAALVFDRLHSSTAGSYKCCRFLSYKCLPAEAASITNHVTCRQRPEDIQVMLTPTCRIRIGTTALVAEMLHSATEAGSNGSSSDESDRVTIEVPKALLKLMPSHVRADSKLRDRYLREALEIGIRAVSQAGISLDTSFVQSSFADFAADVRRQNEESKRSLEELLSGQLTGQDSRLAQLLQAELGERGRLARLLEDSYRQLADRT